MTFTVLGGDGFIGRSLKSHLTESGYVVFAPSREQLDNSLEVLHHRKLGHLIYCIGLTGDFRQRPLETIDAHVCLLNQVLQKADFSSLTYLSSTRVYARSGETREDGELKVTPDSLDFLYDLSKLTGESACLCGSNRARVVRLSNVYGFDRNSQNFLTSILHEAATKGTVRFWTSPDSEKDYVALADVVRLLPQIAREADFGIYNLASGINTSNQEIGDCLKQLGIEVYFSEKATVWSFPPIDINKVSQHFDPPEKRLTEDLKGLLNQYRGI